MFDNRHRDVWRPYSPLLPIYVDIDREFRCVRGQADGDRPAFVIDTERVQEPTAAMNAADGADAGVGEFGGHLFGLHTRHGEADGGDAGGGTTDNSQVGDFVEHI